MSILKDGRARPSIPNRPKLRVFNEERRCRLWDEEFGIDGEGEGNGEMEYNEALDEGSDCEHDLHGLGGEFGSPYTVSISC